MKAKSIDIIIDEFTDCLVHKKTGQEVKTQIKKVTTPSNKFNNWNFNWNNELENGNQVFSLHILGRVRVQGLISLIINNEEQYVIVNLIEAAPHNIGSSNKEYIGVGPHLFALASKISFENKFDGYVLFESKTTLIDHYIYTLNAKQIGKSQRLFLDTNASLRLVEKYYPDLRGKGF